jgi:hypothetical protein
VRILTRAVLVLGLSAATAVATSVPALADGGWGNTDCTQNPNPGCQLGAGQNGTPGQGEANPPPAGSGTTNHGGGGSGGNSAGGQGDVIIGGGGNLANCGYVRSDYQPPTGATQTAAVTGPGAGGTTFVRLVAFRRARTVGGSELVDSASGPSGAWYVYQCSGPGFHDAVYRPPVWMADGPPAPGGPPPPSPAQLAQQAYSQLRLPSPRIEANPTGEQLVGLPTWLWLDHAGWGDVSATASVPGVSVTAVARPTLASWSMGDGATLTCMGPGTAFTAGDNPQATSPDCGYTYRSSSAGEPDQAYPVATTVHWTVTWSGAGQGGTFPDLTTTSTAAFEVAESQALNTSGG